MKGESTLKKQLDVHGKGMAVCKVRLIVIMTVDVYLAIFLLCVCSCLKTYDISFVGSSLTLSRGIRLTLNAFWQAFGHPTPTLTWLVDGIDISGSRVAGEQGEVEGRGRETSLSLGEEDQKALLSCVASQPGSEVPLTDIRQFYF